MSYDFPFYAPAYLINFVLTAVVAVLAFRRRNAPGAVAFAGVMAAASLWSFAQFFESGAPTVSGRMFWSGVQYIGAVALSPTWLLFASQYAGVRLVEGRRIALLYIIPAITLLLVWTSPFHTLIWTNITVHTDPMPYAVYGHGLWFWVNALYSYVTVITGSVLLIRETIYAPRIRQYQTLALVAGAIAPLVANMIYVLDLSPWPGLDLTSFAFTISGLLYLPALVNLHVLDITPVARGAVIEQMTDAVIVTDLQLRVADINSAVSDVLGVDTTTWIGRPFLTVLAAFPELTALASGLEPTQVIVPIRYEAEQRYIDARKSILSDRRDNPIGVVFLLHDVTQLKLAEQQSFDLALEHERVQLLSRFIRDASHEFRTPLTVINTSLYLMDRSTDPAGQRTHRDKIAAQVERIDTLLDEMLTMSRLDDREPLAVSDIDMNAVVCDVVQANADAKTEPGTAPAVTLDLAERLPNVRGDAAQLRRALANLLNNALTHSGPGVEITIATRERDEFVVITLSDTGAGMDAALQRRIFERFFRTDDAHTTPGFGLGLPMARAIVEAHGGSIDVASAPGAGTIFTVQLPARSSASSAKDLPHLPVRLSSPLRPTPAPAVEMP